MENTQENCKKWLIRNKYDSELINKEIIRMMCSYTSEILDSNVERIPNFKEPANIDYDFNMHKHWIQDNDADELNIRHFQD